MNEQKLSAISIYEIELTILKQKQKNVYKAHREHMIQTLNHRIQELKKS